MEPAIVDLIHGADAGNVAAAQQLFAALYSELHRVAERQLRRAGADLSLGTTTLLHETYLDIASREGVSFPDRARFMGYASRAMRTLVIDYARRSRAKKRGGGWVRDHAHGFGLGGREVRGALEGLEAGLRWTGFYEGKRVRQTGAMLIVAAQCALEVRELEEAERLARQAYEVAAIDSAALRQSALVGESSLTLAKVLRVKGDVAGARTWASRALPPLTYGFGADHPRTAEARALRDSLTA